MTKISGVGGWGRGSENGDLSFAPTAFMSRAYGNTVNANSFQPFRSLL